MSGGQGDERAGGTSVGVDEGVGRDRGAVERAANVAGGIEPAAVGVHLDDDRAGARGFRGFDGAAEKQIERRRDFSAQLDDDTVAFVHNLTCVRRRDERGEPEEQE